MRASSLDAHPFGLIFRSSYMYNISPRFITKCQLTSTLLTHTRTHTNHLQVGWMEATQRELVRGACVRDHQHAGKHVVEPGVCSRRGVHAVPSWQNKDLKLFAPAAIATGIFSGLFHASQSRFFQFFDFVGMYMFCMVAVTINCRRLGLFGRQQQVAVYMLGVVTCTLLTPILTAMNIPIQLIVVFLIGCAGITELKAFK